MIGSTVFHYKILEKLGEGGMGVVYKAEDLTLTRTVALKFLPTGLDAQLPKRARFLDEARAAALLNHPNICTIYDFAEHNGQQFIVMEYVDGKTLRRKIEDARPSDRNDEVGRGGSKIEDCIRYAIQIAEALREAHTHGIVHRDIKSDNIMVNAKNQVKVMDFGLAKLKGSLRITKTSGPLGTPTYMSPEQIQGGEVDARSDIFSFGIVFYEMLTGHLPFRGEHESAMAFSIVKDEPEPLQHYVADASSELLHVIGRSLEKNPEDRYQTMQDMLIDLRRLNKESVKAPPQPQYDASTPRTFVAVPTVMRKRSWKRILAVGALVLAVLCVFSILLLLPRAPTVRLNPNRTFAMLQVPFKEVFKPSLSGDGKWIVFPAKDEKAKCEVYFMNTAAGTPSRVTDEAAYRIYSADISPDGSRIVYDVLDGPGGVWKTKIVASQGGWSRTLADTGFGPRWRPDGQRIAYARLWPQAFGRLEIWSMKPDGTDDHCEFTDTVSTDGYVFFCWSPDGGSIAWSRTYPGGFSELIVRELATGKEQQLTYDKQTVGGVSWMKNGNIVFISTRSRQSNLWMIPATGGEAIPVVQGIIPILEASVSSDVGTVVYYQWEQINHLWVSAIDGSNARQLLQEDFFITYAKTSPDRKHIATVQPDVDLGKPEAQLFIMDRDGKNHRQLTFGSEPVWYCSWSPDGKWLAYSTRLPGEPYDSTKIYLIQPFNPSPPRLLCKTRGGLFSWVDSQRVAVGQGMQSLLCSINGGFATRFFQDSTFAIPIQNNTRVLFSDFRKGREGLWLASIDALGRQKGEASRMLDSSIGYAVPVGTAFILYVKHKREIWRVSTSTGKEERIGEAFDLWKQVMVDVSIDGEEILWVRYENRSKLALIKDVFE